MLIDAAHAEETRVVVLDGKKLEEFDFESSTKKQLKGNIYLAKVTRVEPSLQAAFLEYGGNRHGFLPFSEIHPDYYQIPVEDRQALLNEEAAQHAEDEARENGAEEKKKPRRRSRKAVAAETEGTEDVALTEPAEAEAETDTDGENGTERTPVESLGHDDELEEVRAPKARPRRNYKIQEVIKRRQILLVQVVKEERGNKGAALTTYLSLAGRYCVLMPNTSRGGGVSRKIANPADRKRLKGILGDLDMPEGVACIIRTAGTERTKPEIRRDYDYLIRLWDQTRQLTLKSMAPALIYEEGSLIKRAIRDVYSREVDEVQVEGEAAYRTAKDFMRLLMPSHAKKVQHYTDRIPLFHRFQVEGQLDSMFNPTVELRSGGYIVINPTEALVAVDVNSGRATREHNIEETAYKTNLEAAEEISRQLRLRDMAGLVVIDFIDMEDNRNIRSVEKRMKDSLKSDRARIQVGRISHFGLMELSRQRLRPGVLEASTRPCVVCHGSGIVRSVESCSLQIIRILEEEGIRGRSAILAVHVPVEVALFLLNEKRRYITQLEERFAVDIRVHADDDLIAPNYRLERIAAPADGEGAEPRADRDERSEKVERPERPERPERSEPREQQPARAATETDEDETQDGESRSKRRRRRRRRRGRGHADEHDTDTPMTAQPEGAEEPSEAEGEAEAEASAEAESEQPAPEQPGEDADGEKKPRRRRARGRRKPQDAEAAQETAEAVDDVPAEAAPEGPAEAPVPEVADVEDTAPAEEEAKPKRRRAPRKRKPKDAEADAAAEAPAAEQPPSEPVAVEPERVAALPDTPEEPAQEAVAEPEPQSEPAEAKPKGPTRRGWWQRAKSALE
jgi:ribonuclease E